jgi:hypothetical protein
MKLISYVANMATKADFVSFWNNQYDLLQYPEEPYAKNLGKLTEQSIMVLFEWKNGGKLSARKEDSVRRNYINRVDEVRALGSTFTAPAFLERFARGGAIWRIFWLHCCRRAFPMFDQHVYRAMLLIEGQACDELDGKSDVRKIELYLTQYLPFLRRFAGIDPRKLDRALWSYGRFLKQWRFPLNVI